MKQTWLEFDFFLKRVWFLLKDLSSWSAMPDLPLKRAGTKLWKAFPPDSWGENRLPSSAVSWGPLLPLVQCEIWEFASHAFLTQPLAPLLHSQNNLHLWRVTSPRWPHLRNTNSRGMFRELCKAFIWLYVAFSSLFLCLGVYAPTKPPPAVIFLPQTSLAGASGLLLPSPASFLLWQILPWQQ